MNQHNKTIHKYQIGDFVVGEFNDDPFKGFIVAVLCHEIHCKIDPNNIKNDVSIDIYYIIKPGTEPSSTINGDLTMIIEDEITAHIPAHKVASSFLPDT